MSNTSRKITALLIVLLAPGATAVAQAPQRTEATYGDWTVRCQMQAGNPPQKMCDVAQEYGPQVAGQSPARAQTTQVTQVMIARRSKRDQIRLVIQVQPNVLIGAQVKFVYDDKLPGLVLPFSRCFPTACFASGPFPDDVAKKLRSRTLPGRIEFTDGGERKVTVPVSFKGFATAFDVWLKE
jgi:invasion protein IalB